MSPELMVRLADACLDYADDDNLRVAIITGAGDRAFSSGAVSLFSPAASTPRSAKRAADSPPSERASRSSRRTEKGTENDGRYPSAVASSSSQ